MIVQSCRNAKKWQLICICRQKKKKNVRKIKCRSLKSREWSIRVEIDFAVGCSFIRLSLRRQALLLCVSVCERERNRDWQIHMQQSQRIQIVVNDRWGSNKLIDSLQFTVDVFRPASSFALKLKKAPTIKFQEKKQHNDFNVKCLRFLFSFKNYV